MNERRHGKFEIFEGHSFTDEIIEALQADAGVIVEDVLSHDMLSRIKSELSPYLAADAFGRDEFTGFKTKRIGALIARSQACGELALNPWQHKLPAHFLNPTATITNYISPPLFA